MENQHLRTTDYFGTSTSLSTSTFQYLDGSLDFVHRPEGYVKAVHTGKTTEFHYVFHYTDHLGNIRLSYGRDPETNEVAILKESHYYPFGLQHKGYVGNHTIFGWELTPIGRVNLVPVRNYLDDSYRYTFGGKEEQPELGLNWIDHHARNYDAALGRWMSPDPLAEEYSSWSPYNYVMNNPVRYVDPTGMYVEEAPESGQDWIKNRYGFYLWDNNAVNQKTTRSGWTYVGEDLPSEVGSYHILTEIEGNLYHKNTTNLGSRALNKINSWFGGSDDYFVEHKSFDPVTENTLNEGVNTGVSMVGGGLVSKGFGKGLNYLSKGASSSSTRGVNLIDDFASSYSKAAPGLTRAPKGGVTIAGRYYKGGQFTPRPRLHFGKGNFSNFNTLPFGSSSIRPTPVNYNAPSSLRWLGGLGGSSLSLLNSYKQMNK